MLIFIKYLFIIKLSFFISKSRFLQCKRFLSLFLKRDLNLLLIAEYLHLQSSNTSKMCRLMFIDITDESAQLPTSTSLQSNLVAFKERTS